MATQVATSATNFSATTTALVLARIAENIRRDARYLVPGSYMNGTIIQGTNLIRHVSYGDLSILAPAQSDGTPPWLTEGTTPTELDFTIGYDEFAVNQIGKVVAITDRALDYNPHNLMSVAAERIAWDAVATVDAIVASVVQAITATTPISGNAAAALGVGDYLTPAQVRRIVALLRAARIPPIVGQDYYAMVHPYALYDLMGNSEWQNVQLYGQTDGIMAGEVGRLYGVRFIENTVGTWVNNTGGGAAVPVYSTLFFGREYFALGDFGSMETYMVTGPDKSDPLNQKSKVGYKGYIGAKVLTTLGTRARRLVHAGSMAGSASI